MLTPIRKARFKDKMEMRLFLQQNNYKQIRGMKNHYMNEHYCAVYEFMPASKTHVLHIGVSDR